MSQLKSSIQGFLGIEFAPVSHVERLVSTLGGFAGILGIMLVSSRFVDPQATVLIVASMGASAVLLFAVPHGPLSQPWSLVGGHLVSAFIGVGIAKLIPHPFIAASLAVGLAIGAMHYLRCIHPPGGATAIFAVIGGPGVHALGFQYVLTPILLNVLVILTVAIAFNAMFPWRRYPAWLKAREKKPANAPPDVISHGDLVYALSEIDSFIDVSEEDLLRIYSMATRRALARHLDPSEIRLWRYYSNHAGSEDGDDWSVRRIVDESAGGDGEPDTVIYKVMDGRDHRSTGHVPRQVFAQWARYEVEHDGERWVPVQRESTAGE